MLAWNESVCALSSHAVVVRLSDVQLIDHRLVEEIGRKLILGNAAGSVTNRTSCRQNSGQDVTDVSDGHSQQGSFRNGGHRILQISAQISSGVDAGTSRKENRENGEERMRLSGQRINREIRPHVPLKVFDAVAHKALGFLLVCGRYQGSRYKVQLSGNQNNLNKF